MRHVKMSKRNVKNLASFKQQVGSVLSKINELDEHEKTKAITYIKKCIDPKKKTPKPKQEVHLNSSLIKKKFTFKKMLARKKSNVKPTVFKCRVCEEARTGKSDMFKHLEGHVGTPVTCIKCRRTFNSSVAFEWHHEHLCGWRRRNNWKVFKCNECPKVFRFRRHLECHQEGHKRNNCTYCDTVLTHRKELVRHTFEVHGIKLETALHNCQECEKKFVKKRSLYYHMQQHIPDKNVCLECGTISNSHEEHCQHIKNHQEQKPYKCSKCSERFSRRQQYLSHLRRHDRYKCLTCEETYSSRAKVLRHKQKGHKVDGLQPRMKCPYCPTAFHRRTSLRMHVKKHTAIKITINCKYCDKTFQSPYKYYKHCMTLLHDKQSPETSRLVCESCGKQFRKKYLLEQHLFSVHNLNREPLNCNFCDYKTHNKPNLERHVALHLSQSSKCVCEQCGKTYSSVASLKDHISYMHENEKHFRCDQCGKIFKRNSDLIRHFKTHSNDRPFVCKSCGKTYKRSAHLRRHEESAHMIFSKGRKVQRLQTDENGELVPAADEKKVEKEENIEEMQYAILQNADVPMIEDLNSDFVLFL